MSKLKRHIKAALEKAHAWLTDARAKAVHATLGTIAALGMTVGWITDVQSVALLGLAGSTLALAQGALSLIRLTPSDAARWLGTAGRALIFGAAASAGAVGLAFGLLGDGDVDRGLGILSAVLTVASTALSIANVHTVDAPRPSPDVDPATLTRSEYQDIVDGQ